MTSSHFIKSSKMHPRHPFTYFYSHSALSFYLNALFLLFYSSSNYFDDPNKFDKSLSKPLFFDFLDIINEGIDYKMDIFPFQITKFRPSRLRYRNDEDLFGNPCIFRDDSERVVCPLLTDQRPSLFWQQNDTSRSINVPDPSLEDIELIDVLWRRDIDAEKGGDFLGNSPAEQYERDLQVLTEKSIHQPLSTEEQRTFATISRGYFDSFYNEKRPCQPQDETSSGCLCDKTEKQLRWERQDCLSVCEVPNCGADGLSQPAEDCFQLNGTSEEIQNPVLNNVSLFLAAPFNTTNATDSVIAPVCVALPSERSSQDLSPTSSAGFTFSPLDMLTPALALNDSDSNFWFSSAELRNDVNQSYVDEEVLQDVSPISMSSLRPASEISLHSYASCSSTDCPIPSFSSGTSERSNYAEINTVPSERELWSEAEEGSVLCGTTLASRTYGKLIPKVPRSVLRPDSQVMRNSHSSQECVDAEWRSDPNSDMSGQCTKRRRGRQSKDELLAARFNLPATAADISDMSLGDLQKLLRLDSLDDVQRNLIRKIRRRGKNKLAARTCRRRRCQNALSSSLSERVTDECFNSANSAVKVADGY